MKKMLTRAQRTTVIYGIFCMTFTLVVLQLWLLTGTMHALLGGDDEVVWPAAIASGACLLVNLGMLRYIYSMEDPT